MMVNRSTLVAAVRLAQLYHKTCCKLPVLEISGPTSTSTWCLDFVGKAHKEAAVLLFLCSRPPLWFAGLCYASYKCILQDCSVF